MSLSPAEEAALLGSGGILPVGSATPVLHPFAQTFDRRLCTGTVIAPTSTTMYVTAIYLPGGSTVTGITFCSGSTAESGGSHLWFALYKPGSVQTFNGTLLSLMAQTADSTGAADFAANTALRLTLTTAQRIPTSGIYYLGVCVTGTPMTLINIVGAANGGVNGMGNIAGMTPILAATADTSLGASAPATTVALVPVVNAIWACVD